jgi:NDP-sugar pyrophosphorylase family protein
MRRNLRGPPAGNEPLLVINGDILSRVDYQAMLAYHRSHAARLTVGVRQYDVQVPYGVTEVRDGKVVGLSEKPVFNFFVNAGIYVLEPFALKKIPPTGRFDMTDLIQVLVEAGESVASFPIHEYWLDVGRHEDYCQAQLDYSNEQKV